MADRGEKDEKPVKAKRAKRGNGCVRARPKGQKHIWELRYSLGKDATGKRRVITLTFRGTETAANAELRRRLGELDKGQHVNPTRLTVALYIEKWLTDWAATNVSPKTRERYAELLRKHVAANIGNLPIQKLGAIDLVNLYSRLLKEGRDDGAGLSPRTVTHVHRALHRALRHAVLWKVVQSNAASTASAPRVESSEIEILQPDQIKRVMAELRGHPVYPLMVTALGSGARRGELLALRWQDVNMDRGEFRIERSVEQTKPDEKNKSGLRIKSPKTKYGRRTVALPAFVVSELRAVWTAQQKQRLALGLGKSPPESLVFGTVTGDLRRPDSLTKQWALAAKSVGIKVTLHALRHTHVSQLIAANVDVLSISRRIGHANPSITLNVYSHLFRNSQEPAVAALDAVFSSVTLVGTD
jgi:integrase